MIWVWIFASRRGIEILILVSNLEIILFFVWIPGNFICWRGFCLFGMDFICFAWFLCDSAWIS